MRRSSSPEARGSRLPALLFHPAPTIRRKQMSLNGAICQDGLTSVCGSMHPTVLTDLKKGAFIRFLAMITCHLAVWGLIIITEIKKGHSGEPTMTSRNPNGLFLHLETYRFRAVATRYFHNLFVRRSTYGHTDLPCRIGKQT